MLLVRTVTESLLFQAVLAPLAVALTFVVVGVTAVPLADAAIYLVVPPVATVTSPVVPEEIVTVGLVTLKVLEAPRTLSVVGVPRPVNAVTLSPLAETAAPEALALSFVVVAEP